MTQLTLIITGRDRKYELSRFCHSVNLQEGVDFSTIQLIFVDQGSNREIFDCLNKQIEFKYIRSTPCSLSHARNIGLQYVNGVFIGFPDDDCWYEPDTLKNVLNLLSSGYDGLVGYGTDEAGTPTNVFASKSQPITLFNHCGAISYTIFLKYSNCLTFDENLGVGSPYNFLSGEESDYLIRFMKQVSGNVYYSKEVNIHHPSAKSDYFVNETKKMYYYSRGYGYLMKKHSYPIKIVITSFIRPIGGIVIYSASLNFKKAKRSWNILKGRLEGYMQYNKYKL